MANQQDERRGRDMKIEVRVTAAEREAIIANATDDESTVSDWLRRQGMKPSPRKKQNDRTARD